MKKLKRFFGVFAVALFMLSTSNIQGAAIVELKKEKDCFSICDLYADLVGHYNGLDHYDEYLIFMGCMSVC